MLAMLLATVITTKPDPATGAVLSIGGRRHRPLAEAKGKVVALVFIAHDCPICNAYAPELKRIANTYDRRGALVELVYAEPNLSLKDARAHARAYSYSGLSLFLDPRGDLAKACGVTVTPEVALYDSHRRLVYRGRIDDQYVAFGKQRMRVTSHDLRSALDATLAHKPIHNARTDPIGCFISTVTS